MTTSGALALALPCLMAAGFAAAACAVALLGVRSRATMSAWVFVLCLSLAGVLSAVDALVVVDVLDDGALGGSAMRAAFKGATMLFATASGMAAWLRPRAASVPHAELRLAQARERTSDARFRAAIDAMRDSFFIYEAARDARGSIVDFRITDMNVAAEKRYGPRSVVIGTMASSLPIPVGMTAEQITQLLVRVMDSGQAIEVEGQLRTAISSVTTWSRAQFVPLDDGIGFICRDITTERAERQMHELHSAIVRNMHEGVCLVRDFTGEVLYANLKLEKMLGYEPGELAGRPIFTLAPEYIATEGGFRFDAVHDVGEAAAYEVRLRTKGGTVVHCRGSTSMVQHPEHGRIGVAILEDITEQKVREETLRASEASFQALVEGAPVGVLVLRDGRIVFANAALLHTLGYAHVDALQGASVVERLIAPEDRDFVAERLRATAREPVAVPIPEAALLRANGTRTLAETTAVQISFGGAPAIVAIVRDVAERRRADEMRARLVALVEGSSDAIIGMRLDGVITEWNPAAERLFGYSRSEALDADLSIMVPTTGVDEMRALIARIEDGERIENLETQRARKDGSTFDVSLTISPIRSAQGTIIGLSSIVRDISSSKQNERFIRRSLEEKEVLLKEIHHRVKNNLQVVSSLLSLQARSLTDARSQELFAQSQARVRSMALVHEKLYQSKDLASIDFGEYLDALLGEIQRSQSAPDERVQVRSVIERLPMRVDVAIPCGLIINELVTNALKHAFPDGRSGVVDVEIERCGMGRARLTVRDDGVGIPAEIDVHATETLGLDLVATLAVQLDANIDVQCQGGTRIDVTFPIEDAAR